MPLYKNRPTMPSATTVWRYLGLDAVVATLQSRKLRFTRTDTFEDIFEGSVPARQLEGQLVLFNSAYTNRNMWAMFGGGDLGARPPRDDWEDPWIRMTRLRHAIRRSSHTCSWAAGDESVAMWRLYCDDDGKRGLGVALRTALWRLEESVAPHDLYVSPITYKDYLTAPAFNDERDSLMHKRHGFAAEREVRLLKYDHPHYSLLVDKNNTAPDLDEHVFLDWPVDDVGLDIVLSPYADEAYEQRAKAAIAAAAPALAGRVVLSDLNARKNAPGF